MSIHRRNVMISIAVFLGLSVVCYAIPYEWLAIIPRDKTHLAGILVSPLAHGSAEHLLYNFIYFIPFAVAICFLEKRPMYPLIGIYLLTGTLVWIFGKEGLHIGMSGFAIGCSTYLVAAGLFNLSWEYLIIGGVTLSTQLVILSNIFTPQEGVSDDAHISGALAGSVIAFVTHYLEHRKK